MKRLSSILLLFFLLIQINSGYAQGENFAPIGAEWYHDRTGSEGSYYGYTKSTSVKDTMIDGKTCRVINSMIVEKPSSSQLVDTTYQEASMIVYTTPDTVYYFNNEIGRFIPLYIFNVNVGDTISYRTPFEIPNNPDFPIEDTIFRIRITDVGTTELNGSSLKTISYTALDRWGFSSVYTIGFYIERIGTTRTPLLSHFPIVTRVDDSITHEGDSIPPYLRCYTDELIDFQFSSHACDYVNGLNTNISNNLMSTDFQIYPNPAKDYLRIRNTDGNHPVTSIEVYDIVGRKVKTVVIENVDREHILPIADLPAGNYILKIRSKEQSVNRKLSVR